MSGKPRKNAGAPRARGKGRPSPSSAESAVRAVEDALFTRAIEGNVAAQVFFLCNRAHERWRSTGRVALAGGDDEQLGRSFAELMRAATEGKGGTDRAEDTPT